MALDYLLEKIAPYECVACQKSGPLLCNNCFELAGSPPPPRCIGCKTLSDGYNTCKTCRKWLPLSAAYVATTYEGIEQKLLHAYKFKVQRGGAKQIAKIMLQVMPADIDVDVISWVPTAAARRRARGFDHAKLLACEIAKAMPSTQARELLNRKSNVRQLGASRTERLKHMQDEFTCGDDLKNKSILLIDDVTTTGASLAAASRVLKNAGARDVRALLFAQKL